jgi:hypothetical protein
MMAARILACRSRWQSGLRQRVAQTRFVFRLFPFEPSIGVGGDRQVRPQPQGLLSGLMGRRSVARSRMTCCEPKVMLPMAPHRALQDGHCLTGTLSHEQRADHVEIVTMGGERIEPHCPFDPRNSGFGLAQKSQVNTALHDKTRIIGIKRQRTFEMVFALGVLAFDECNAGHDAMTLSVVRI